MLANFQADNFRPDHAHFNFIINYAVVLVTLSLIVLAFDRINKVAFLKIKNQNAELSKANEELDRFVYSVSHDLRSPLTSILGLVNVYNVSTSEEEKLKVVQLIRERTLILDDFIRKILDYSRNARAKLTMEPIQLGALINTILDTLRYMPQFDLVDIQINLPANFSVMSDQERLKIILSNLFSNAIKYMDRTKDKPYVKISAKTEGAKVLITVEDNGIGIRPDRIGRIFEMFYRASEFSTGSGIGLYIVRECTDNLDARIAVESTYAKGTTIKVEIPQA
jgi:signal transduction histidine kinase